MWFEMNIRILFHRERQYVIARVHLLFFVIVFQSTLMLTPVLASGNGDWAVDWTAETIIQYRYFTDAYDQDSSNSPTNIENQIFIDQQYSDQQQFPILNQRLGFSTSDVSGDQLITGDFFFHYDHYDENNRYVDVRELDWLYSFDDYQVRAGVGQVSWGVNEIFRTVDTINQIDTQAWPSRTKLGQPLISFAGYLNDDLLEAYILLDHRKRRYSGINGRLRYPILIDEDPIYDRGATGRVDFALRWQFSLWNADVALSHFYGVSRDPYFSFNFDFDHPRLVPVYQKINQSSIELIRDFDGLLTKFEAKYEMGGLQHYSSYAGGIEVSFSGVMRSDIDITLIVEAIYDSRDEANNNIFNRDVALAFRLQFNDSYESSLLVAGVQDYEYSERLLLLHWRSNPGEHWRFDAILNVFQSSEKTIDRTAFDAAWNDAFSNISSGNIPLPISLVNNIYASISEVTLSRRDFENVVTFINSLQQPGGYKSSYADTVPDVLFELMRITDESQKVNLIDEDDYLAISISYLF